MFSSFVIIHVATFLMYLRIFAAEGECKNERSESPPITFTLVLMSTEYDRGRNGHLRAQGNSTFTIVIDNVDR